MPSSYLVTGGAGFIGSSIARALLARGDKVRVIDNFSSGKRENLADVAGDIELIEGDIRDPAALARACAGVEVVFHEAAIPSVPRSMADPLASNDANVDRHAERAARGEEGGRRRVVYAASSSAYGDTPTLPKVETMRPAPLSPYAVVEAGGRALLRGVRGRLRARDGLPALLQRVRRAPGSEVGVRRGDPALRHRRRWRARA